MWKMSGSQAARCFPDESLDFIYIDADHTYEAVVNDIKVWYPKLKVGGLFGGHDYWKSRYFGRNFGVIQAVNEFAQEYDKSLHLTDDVRPHPEGSINLKSWWVLK